MLQTHVCYRFYTSYRQQLRFYLTSETLNRQPNIPQLQAVSLTLIVL